MDCSPQGSTGLLFPSAGHLPKPGMEHGSPALQADSLLSEPPGKSIFSWLGLAIKKKSDHTMDGFNNSNLFSQFLETRSLRAIVRRTDFFRDLWLIDGHLLHVFAHGLPPFCVYSDFLFSEGHQSYWVKTHANDVEDPVSK